MPYLYPLKYTTSYYAKKGAPEFGWEYLISEVDKHEAMIQRGEHPYIGYVERKSNKPVKPITDAWWM